MDDFAKRESTLEEEIAYLAPDYSVQKRILDKLSKRIEAERTEATAKEPCKCEGKLSRDWETDFKRQAEEMQKLQLENKVLKASCVNLAIALAPGDFVQATDSARALKMAMNSIYGRPEFKSGK